MKKNTLSNSRKRFHFMRKCQEFWIRGEVDRTWWKLADRGQSWHNLAKIGRTWWKLVELDKNWQNLVKMDRTCSFLFIRNLNYFRLLNRFFHPSPSPSLSKNFIFSQRGGDFIFARPNRWPFNKSACLFVEIISSKHFSRWNL